MPYRGYTESQNRATQKFISNNYKQISIRLKKEEKATAEELTREKIQAAADSVGMSLNAFILNAVAEKIERDINKRSAEENPKAKTMDSEIEYEAFEEAP